MSPRAFALGLLGVLALAAFLPAPANANHTSCTNSNLSGDGRLWIPQPVGNSNCAGFWVSIDPMIVCSGAAHTTVGPLTVSGGRGPGCPTGVALLV